MSSGSRKARAAAVRKAAEAAGRRQRRFTYSMVGLVALVVAGVVLALSLTGGHRASASGIPRSPAVTAQGSADQPPWPAPQAG